MAGLAERMRALALAAEQENAPPPEESTQDKNEADAVPRAAKAQFNALVLKARRREEQQRLTDAIALYTKASALVPLDKIDRKIAKLEEQLANRAPLADGYVRDDVAQACLLDSRYMLPTVTYDKLYSHQREGVKWMWGLHRADEGGILGDDMGLGKTIQVAAFLDGLFNSGLIHSALIVMPLSLLSNWTKEFKTWAPESRVKTFHGSSKVQRNKSLKSVQTKGGVCLTTYGMVVSNLELLNDAGFEWDYVILDEGHRIKDPSRETSKAMREVASKHRFILSGTPIQNNLGELWALFDFVSFGSLLGTKRDFNAQFANPIVQSTDRQASDAEKQLGAELAKQLRDMIAPYFLRREKKTALQLSEQDEGPADALSLTSGTADMVPAPVADGAVTTPIAAMPQLQEKHDFIVWVSLAEAQTTVYRTFLESEKVAELLNTTKSPLAALNVLKKICDHPRLLASHAAYRHALGLDGGDTPVVSPPLSAADVVHTLGDTDTDTDDDESALDAAPSSAAPPRERIHGLLDEDLVQAILQREATPAQLLEQSGKLLCFIRLMVNLQSNGHRVLVFSQSRKMLDIVSHVMKAQGLRHSRLDGTVKDERERQSLVEQFNTDEDLFCMLLTTQVGGVGLTLTGADRVVIFDPSWNPSVDAQAVDRAYRIGQKRAVVVYRLVTCGTIEEKIYRKQVFKGGLQRAAMDRVNPYRYFTRQDLRDLFKLDDPTVSVTQQQLSTLHGGDKTDYSAEMRAHIAFLKEKHIYGLSRHDLLFSKKNDDGHELDDDETDETAATAGALATPRLPGHRQRQRRPAAAGEDAPARKSASTQAEPTRPHAAEGITHNDHGKHSRLSSGGVLPGGMEDEEAEVASEAQAEESAEDVSEGEDNEVSEGEDNENSESTLASADVSVASVTHSEPLATDNMDNAADQSSVEEGAGVPEDEQLYDDIEEGEPQDCEAGHENGGESNASDQPWTEYEASKCEHHHDLQESNEPEPEGVEDASQDTCCSQANAPSPAPFSTPAATLRNEPPPTATESDEDEFFDADDGSVSDAGGDFNAAPATPAPVTPFRVDGQEFASPMAYVLSPAAAAEMPCVCAQHAALASAKTTRCSCYLSGEERVEYRTLRRLGTELETAHNEAAALHMYLSALAICDDDPTLHAACIRMGAHLGYGGNT